MSEIVNIADVEGKIIWPGESHVEEYAWEDLGDITTAENALAADGMDDVSVVALASAKTVIWTPQKRKVALEFRFEMDGSENDTSVLDLYARGNKISSAGVVSADRYTRVATLSLIQGTQDGDTAHFADSIVESNGAWLSSRTTVMPSSADNHIARYLINKHGYTKWLFIATTLGVTTIHVWGRRL